MEQPLISMLLGAVATLLVAALVYLGLRIWRRQQGRVEPMPAVERQPQTAFDARQSFEETDEPVMLAQLRLHNVRSFASLDMQFGAPASGGTRGQWTLLLGDNGVGKSTILRSLVLALVDPDVATAVLQTQESPAPLVRRGHGEGRIDLTLGGNRSYAVLIRPGANSERLALEAASSRPGLFAYGPRRGSALGRSARQVSFTSVGAVATLFDESAEMIHAETWLKGRQLAALQSRGGPDEAFFEAIIEMVRQLLPGVQSIDVTATGVEVSGRDVGNRVPLAGMSDGYLGTIGWVLDLVARWSHRRQRIAGKTPDGSITEAARGLVVVDEIGLHLHPSWQTTIVADITKQLPNMSFIATSHHPLVLLGAHQGEIHVLRRNPETTLVEIEQANIPPGTTADQILTGRWFNLPSTLDEGTKQLLEEHRGILRQGTGEDDSRRVELEGILRSRLGTFADTSIERMALHVAAEVMGTKESSFDKLTPARREAIREEMLRELRARTDEE